MKNFLCVAIVCAVVVSVTSQVHATREIVISSQVRGKECCDVGTDSALDLQVQTLAHLHLPATFALRYDALEDLHTIEVLKKTSFEKASLLEITPSLAKDAGVSYRGPVDRWYKAGNAYLIGYDQDSRKKIIDTYMKKFFLVFGSYPQSSVAWMIDSWSLSYLETHYQLQVHEITRDQWGTDSYTLYGGPINVPYYPSKNWSLVPASDRAHASDVLLVRQTLTDALYTYGDEQSAHTSQPNDYLFGQQTTQYFEQLLTNAMDSTFPGGFAVLGLETSMEPKYQNEFAKQLQIVSTLESQRQAVVTTLGDLRQTHQPEQTIATMSAYVSPSQDASRHAYWINAKTYRARLIADAHQVVISDLRVYSDALKDPYSASASATVNAYWTVPFLFDGSRFRTEAPVDISLRAKNFVSRLLSDRRGGTDFHVTENDFSGQATGLSLPLLTANSSIKFVYTYEASNLQYHSDRGIVHLKFTPSSIQVSLPPGDTYRNTVRDPELLKLSSSKLLSLQEDTSNGITTLTPTLDATASTETFSTSFPSLFHPEQSQGPASSGKSSFLLANRRAIVGRNPIRLVIRLVDSAGLPTISPIKPVVLLTDTTVKTTIFEPESAHGEYYIDLASDHPTQSNVIVSFGSLTHDFGTVNFVPNCTKMVSDCIKHPYQLSEFVLSKFDEIIRRLRN